MYNSGVPSGVAIRSVQFFNRMGRLTVLAVDLSSHGTKVSFEVLVLLDIFPARYGDLNKDNFILQLRVIVEEGIETTELLRQTFDMVQPINAYYHLYAFVAFSETSNSILNLGHLEGVGELLWVDANNELVDANKAVFILYLIWDLGAGITFMA